MGRQNNKGRLEAAASVVYDGQVSFSYLYGNKKGLPKGSPL
jgi:hypothetical protein